MNKEEQLNQALDEIIQRIVVTLPQDKHLRRMFIRCFENTGKTTTRLLERDETFLITGDIEAMWLRDSAAQVIHYLPFAKEYPVIKEMIKGLIRRQIKYIGIDSYANAFNKEDNGNFYHLDDTQYNPWVWERKYEVDSLCYPIWLVKQYYDITKDTTIFNLEMKKAFGKIINQWKIEQYHDTKSTYSFQRNNCPLSDTLSNKGKGEPTAYTGMTWSGFRPSDDACQYGYLIPSNMFAVVVLEYMCYFLEEIYLDDEMLEEAKTLKEEIKNGIENYGIVKTQEFGEIYAYEVDGFGKYNLMDDANVPSLLSIPWLTYTDNNSKLYKNTRKYILSKNNPYYYEGIAGKGIGSPHTPVNYIWHISLIMQGLTSDSKIEREKIMAMLLSTDGGKEYMHEGFNCESPKQFTRPWFAWANSLFALFVMDLYFN